MPLFRNSTGASPAGFRAPKLVDPNAGLGGDGVGGKVAKEDANEGARPSMGLRAGMSTTTPRAERSVNYPPPLPAGEQQQTAPPSTSTCSRPSLGGLGASLGAERLSVPGVPSLARHSTAAERPPEPEASVLVTEEKKEESEESIADLLGVAEVVAQLPVSPHDRLYFQAQVVKTAAGNGEAGGALASTGTFDGIGIVIVEVETPGIQMFDRFGRQHGNRPDPGYPIKPSEVENLRAGVTVKVGMKSVLLTTALSEEAFRSGEFFLRTEHNSRKREEKRKEKEATIPRHAKISFGSGFAALQFRKTPRAGASGFVVPVAGRIKTGPGGGARTSDALVPLHDHDAPNAMVLFRADYKRDAQNRPICSVVVDPIIGDKLRPHQRIGVQFLYDCVTGEQMPGYYGAILADEMGLGKTIQTVATIWTCLKQGKHGTPVSTKCVVVAPSSLVRNWCNEFDKWLGEGKVKHFAIAESSPKGDRILSRFEGEGDVLVISYDQLRKYVQRLKTIKAIDLIVCDEGHRLKNAEIKTTKAVDMMPSKRRIILSGTPIQNDLIEFHAMVDFVNPGVVGTNDLFKRVFEEAIMHGRDPDTDIEEKELGQDRAHYLANLTTKFILRRTQTINEKYLPPKVDATVFCGLGDSQRFAYEAISLMQDQFSSTPLLLITALKKLCSHMDLLYEAVAEEKSGGLPKSILPKGFKKGSLSPSSGSKMAFVSLMLDQLKVCKERDKLVIVSNYTQTLNLIAKLCEAKKVQYFQLDGTTPIKKRQELVDRFNIPIQQELVFLLSSKAGGVGLNLVGANRLILFDPDWNPANDAQAMGRVWRDGQKKRVFLYRLLSTGSIEEKIYQRQVSKQGLSANVVDMKEDSKQEFSGEELRALFTYKSSTSCDTHDLLGCRCMQPVDPVVAANGGVKQFRRVIPQTGPRMDELKSWMHVKNAQTFALDPMLATMCGIEPKLVTFLFANERDALKLEQTINAERAFVADESGITCPTQGEDPDTQMELNLVDDDSDDDC